MHPILKSHKERWDWELRAFSVNIIGLSKRAHHFDFQLGDGFFETYGTHLVSAGEFRAEVILDKRETFIEADFKIKGHARLICDRSLEPFDHPVDIDKRIVFKYGEEETELSDEIMVIPHDRASLELGQYLYEFIALDMPMKKLHPKFRDTDDGDTEGRMIYTSGPDKDQGKDDVIDPRWEKLKKLK